MSRCFLVNEKAESFSFFHIEKRKRDLSLTGCSLVDKEERGPLENGAHLWRANLQKRRGQNEPSTYTRGPSWIPVEAENHTRARPEHADPSLPFPDEDGRFLAPEGGYGGDRGPE
uniref:Uncharacterized protein n=1 Tax=Aegilops tauschii subsp. strangulata TaxID=200361 RepID=A0A452ZNR8_AEGTS